MAKSMIAGILSKIPVLVCAALIAGLAPLAAVSAHGHAAWIMANPDTRYCCGPKDCRPLELTADKVEIRAGRYFLNGHAVKDGSVYPTRDGTARYWACFYGPDYTVPRCLFVPAGV